MAFSMGGNGGSGRGRFRGTTALAEINIVPLVDVVMVLLVIFMLTAHVMEFGMEVEVPKVNQVRDTAQELPVVTIDRLGHLYLNEQAVGVNELAQKVKARFPKSEAVYVRADKDSVWNVIAQVVSELNQGGIKINMVTQPEDEADRTKRRG